VLAKSCVFGKQLIFTLLCTPKGLLLANLQRYFAEFLKDYSAITLAYSAHPLLLVLVLFLVLHYFLPLSWVLREPNPSTSALAFALGAVLTLLRSSFSRKPWVFGVFFKTF